MNSTPGITARQACATSEHQRWNARFNMTPAGAQRVLPPIVFMVFAEIVEASYNGGGSTTDSVRDIAARLERVPMGKDRFGVSKSAVAEAIHYLTTTKYPGGAHHWVEERNAGKGRRRLYPVNQLGACTAPSQATETRTPRKPTEPLSYHFKLFVPDDEASTAVDSLSAGVDSASTAPDTPTIEAPRARPEDPEEKTENVNVDVNVLDLPSEGIEARIAQIAAELAELEGRRDGETCQARWMLMAERGELRAKLNPRRPPAASTPAVAPPPAPPERPKLESIVMRLPGSTDDDLVEQFVDAMCDTFDAKPRSVARWRSIGEDLRLKRRRVVDVTDAIKAGRWPGAENGGARFNAALNQIHEDRARAAARAGRR
jgi:hypothetical protein